MIKISDLQKLKEQYEDLRGKQLDTKKLSQVSEMLSKLPKDTLSEMAKMDIAILSDIAKDKLVQVEEMAKDDAYAIGMAQAKKSMNDEPPLDKKTITKGHEIAKKILNKEEVAIVYTDKKTRQVVSKKFKNDSEARKFIKQFDGAAGQINFKPSSMLNKEDLDKKDVATIKPIIKQLQKSVKSHDKQAKQLTKDISDEKDLEEEIGRISGFKTDKVKKEYETMAKSKGLKTSINSKGSLVIDGPQKAVRDVLTKANIDGINRLTVNIGMGFESLEEQAKELEEQLKTAEKELEELYIKEEKAYVIRFKRIADKERMVVIFTKQSEADMYADNIKKQGGKVFSNKLEKIPYKVVDRKSK